MPHPIVPEAGGGPMTVKEPRFPAGPCLNCGSTRRHEEKHGMWWCQDCNFQWGFTRGTCDVFKIALDSFPPAHETVVLNWCKAHRQPEVVCRVG